MPEYTAHPITARFPRMTPTEYAKLKADIQAQGQQVPIVVMNHQIIDGRHRYQACRELGIPPKVIDATGDPVLLARSLNVLRRHMTADQIAAFYQRSRQDDPALDQKLKAIEDAARDRQRGALKQGSTRPRRGPETPTGQPGRTAARVAGDIGSTETAVKRVARVAREHPEALPAIEAGRVTAQAVLRQGGADRAAAANAAGPRPAKNPTRPSEAPDEFDAAIDQIRRHWQALPGWTSTLRTLRSLTQTHWLDETRRLLDWVVDLRWQEAPHIHNKYQVVDELESLLDKYRHRLEQAEKAAKATMRGRRSPPRGHRGRPRRMSPQEIARLMGPGFFPPDQESTSTS